MAKDGTTRGRPPGIHTTHAVTRSKQEARDSFRRIVDKHMERLIDAQLHNATGIKHFFLRDKTGKFVPIEDAKQIEAALNEGEEGSSYWIFTKDPSVQAFTDLMNRHMDKPSEHVELTGANQGPLVLQWQD